MQIAQKLYQGIEIEGSSILINSFYSFWYIYI
jgi:hypothetical protein